MLFKKKFERWRMVRRYCSELYDLQLEREKELREEIAWVMSNDDLGETAKIHTDRIKQLGKEIEELRVEIRNAKRIKF